MFMNNKMQWDSGEVLMSGKANIRGCAPFEHSSYWAFPILPLDVSSGETSIIQFIEEWPQKRAGTSTRNRIEQAGRTLNRWYHWANIPCDSSQHNTVFSVFWHPNLFTWQVPTAVQWPIFSCLKCLVGMQQWQERKPTVLCSRPHRLHSGMQWHADFAGPYIRAAEESGRLQHMASKTACWAFLSQVASLEKKEHSIFLLSKDPVLLGWGGGAAFSYCPCKYIGYMHDQNSISFGSMWR